jgi:hypothetical protein
LRIFSSFVCESAFNRSVINMCFGFLQPVHLAT